MSFSGEGWFKYLIGAIVGAVILAGISAKSKNTPAEICQVVSGHWDEVAGKCQFSVLKNEKSATISAGEMVCGPSEFMVGISAEGRPLCRLGTSGSSGQSAVDGLKFVGGYISQGMCSVVGGKVKENCEVKDQSVFPECKKNVSPFRIVAEKLEYIFPSPCTEMGDRCYVQTNMGPIQQRNYMKCDYYEVKGYQRLLVKAADNASSKGTGKNE